MTDIPTCSGVRVLELALGFSAASLCGQIFAGLGAEVRKLEPPGGDPLRARGPGGPDGTSYRFHLANAAKRSVVATDEACAGLLDWADVVVWDGSTPWPLPAMDDPQAIAERRPHLVLCTVSPFGLRGERRAWTGGELAVEALSGLMSVTGYPERPAVCSGVPYGLHVGALLGFAGAMAALRERERSGFGQWVDAAVVDGLVALLGNFMPSYFLSGRSPQRVGNRHTIAAPWNLYPTSDGYVMICAGTGGSRWWDRVLRGIGRTDLIGNPKYDNENKRVALVEEVDEIVAERTRTMTMAEVIEAMNAEDVPVSGVETIESILADAQYREARAMIARVAADGATVGVGGLPLKLGAWQPPPAAGPQLGDANAAPSEARTFAATALPAPRDLPLRGITVLEFGARTSVPFGGRLLADLGAEIVKIEPPKGESLRNAGQQIGGSSYLFNINNGGKKSLVVKPDDPQGRRLILDLAAKADVWIENLAPGSLDAMGLGYDDLRAVNPKIVYCSVTGFGHRSTLGKKRALDTVVQAAVGIMHLTGYPDHLPVKIGISAVDLAAAIGLVGAVVGALRRRDLSGSGLHVDLAMADIGVWMTEDAWPEALAGTGSPSRRGNRSAAYAPHDVFEARDGSVAVSVLDDEQWRRLAALIGDAGLAGDARLANVEGRLEHEGRIEAALAAWVADKTAAEVTASCQSAGVAAAPVRDLAAVVDDPEVRARGLVTGIDHPLAGRMFVLGHPLFFSRTPAGVSGYAPLLGEHTAEILRDRLGLSAEAIARLAAEGIVVERERSLP